MDEAEADRVERWLRDFFETLGFAPRQALALLLAGADPHDVEAALSRGCSRELALRIFL